MEFRVHLRFPSKHNIPLVFEGTKYFAFRHILIVYSCVWKHRSVRDRDLLGHWSCFKIHLYSKDIAGFFIYLCRWYLVIEHRESCLVLCILWFYNSSSHNVHGTMIPDLECHSRFATGTNWQPKSSLFATEGRKSYVFITEALAVICEIQKCFMC